MSSDNSTFGVLNADITLHQLTPHRLKNTTHPKDTNYGPKHEVNYCQLTWPVVTRGLLYFCS